MAYPATDYYATYDKTSNAAGTWGIIIDSKLWPALMHHAPLLDRISRFPVDGFEYKWETQNEPTRTFTSTTTAGNAIWSQAGAAYNQITFTDATYLEEGMLIRNATKASPVGTAGVDEIMLIKSLSSATATVKRDYQNTNSGDGYGTHIEGNVFECIGTVKGEGSSAGTNKYRDVSLVTNYTQIMDFYLNVTGSQMESKRMVAGDTLEAQTKMGTAKLANEMETMLLYGALNSGANAGSDTAGYVRTSKGLQQWMAGGNIDYSTKSVTAAALDNLFDYIVQDKTDPTDEFVIVCHPSRAREMSHFGEDLVRTTQAESKWGREIKTFKSDLGIEADIMWTLNCSKSDLFIIDLSKVSIAEFRPWRQTQVTYADDMVDAWRQRVLGEYGFKVVDGQYSHAALQYLTW